MVCAEDAETEVRRFAAVGSHPCIIRLLDIELFASSDFIIGLVLERCDIDFGKFLRRVEIQIAGMRHVLRSVIGALLYMHNLGIVHADLNPIQHLTARCGRFSRRLAWIAGKRQRSCVSKVSKPSCISLRSGLA